MAFRVKFNGKEAAGASERWGKKNKARFQRALDVSSEEARDTIKREGDASIRAGGNFRDSWTDAFIVDRVKTTTGYSITVGFSQDRWYGLIFEYGGIIKPRTADLLWIPLSHTGVKVRARDYPGGLFRVDRKVGRPLLLSRTTGEPIYFGISQVKQRRRFFIRDVIRRTRTQFGNMYRRAMRAA